MKKIVLILMIMMLPVTVMAEGYETGELNKIENTTVEETVENSVEETADEGNTITGNEVVDNSLNAIGFDDDVTVDDVGNRILDKLYDVADLLKKIAAPFSIIMFVIGAILMVTGALGKKDGTKQGITVCILSIVMYAICMYAEPIIVAISNWLVS